MCIQNSIFFYHLMKQMLSLFSVKYHKCNFYYTCIISNFFSSKFSFLHADMNISKKKNHPNLFSVFFYGRPNIVTTEQLRTPELVSLVHRFCASYVSVCTRFRENNQIIIISMKHALCIIHINDYYSKYFV